MIALSGLCRGLDSGEPGVLVTMDESRQALLQHAKLSPRAWMPTTLAGFPDHAFHLKGSGFDHSESATGTGWAGFGSAILTISKAVLNFRANRPTIRAP